MRDTNGLLVGARQPAGPAAALTPEPEFAGGSAPAMSPRLAATAGSGGGSTEPVVPLAVVAQQQREIEELRKSLVQMQAKADAPPTPPRPAAAQAASVGVVSALEVGTAGSDAVDVAKWVLLVPARNSSLRDTDPCYLNLYIWVSLRHRSAKVVAFLERAGLSAYAEAIVEAGYGDLSFLVE